MIELLLEEGANVNIKNNKRETFLHYMADKGKLEAIQVLIKRGATIDDISYYGSTPAMVALGAGYPKIAEILQTDLDPEQRAWIDHKMLAHRFGLSIMVEHQKQTFNLSTYRNPITYGALLESICSAKEWIKVAPPEWTAEDTFDIIQTIEKACKLLDKSHDSLEDKVNQVLKAYDNEEIVIIPTFKNGVGVWHAFEVTLYKKFFILGDRAMVFKKNDASFPMPGLLVQEMNSPENLKRVVFNLLNESSNFIWQDTCELLSLKTLLLSRHKRPHGDVCCWSSSAKLAVQGAFLAQLLKKKIPLKEAEEYSLKMYRVWAKEDRIVAIENYLKNVPPSNVKNTVLACIYKSRSLKKERKGEKDSVMDLIEENAPEVIEFSKFVKITKERTAQLECAI
jgi:hypothetical protein